VILLLVLSEKATEKSKYQKSKCEIANENLHFPQETEMVGTAHPAWLCTVASH